MKVSEVVDWWVKDHQVSLLAKEGKTAAACAVQVACQAAQPRRVRESGASSTLADAQLNCLAACFLAEGLRPTRLQECAHKEWSCCQASQDRSM